MECGHAGNKVTSSLKALQNLCFDESLLLWRDRLAFRQFIPQKHNIFGRKFFILCYVETGFNWILLCILVVLVLAQIYRLTKGLDIQDLL